MALRKIRWWWSGRRDHIYGSCTIGNYCWLVVFFFLHKCIFRNLNDIKQDSDAEYEDDKTGDEDTKDENAPFARKFLVFESNLFYLFQSCYKWLAPAMPRLDKVESSMIVIVSKCSNGHRKTWTSQKCDGRLPWGNMLFAAGTLFTCSNPARVASFFNHVRVLCMSLKT